LILIAIVNALAVGVWFEPKIYIRHLKFLTRAAIEARAENKRMDVVRYKRKKINSLKYTLLDFI